MIFVFLDEHPDSINDGWFVFCTSGDPSERSYWSDLPASYHNGAGGFAFADGHSEIRKWVGSRTVPALKPGRELSLNVASPNNQDVKWLMDRTTRSTK